MQRSIGVSLRLVNRGKLDGLTDDELRARYEDVVGEKPHHKAGRDSMIERIKAKQAE